jgi:hypothetical protein
VLGVVKSTAATIAGAGIVGIAATASPTRSLCSVERWTVKTLQDRVGFGNSGGLIHEHRRAAA